MFEIESAVLTHVGRKRSHNEDFVAYFEPDNLTELRDSGRLYIVADGVGGAERGERASQYAAQKVLYDYYLNADQHPGDRLRQAIQRASTDINLHTEDTLMGKMATTLVAVAIAGDTMTVANVGDSRAYLIRNGRISQVTRDHSLVGEMVRNGSMSEEEAAHSKIKNKLTRSVGGEAEVHVDIFADIPLEPGDRILLCSDGLTRYKDRGDLLTMATLGSPAEAAARLVQFANDQGGVDNISTILVQIGLRRISESSVIAPRRGAVPTPVDFDTMATQPLPFPPEKSRRTLSGSLRKNQNKMILGIGSLAALMLLSLAVAIVWKNGSDIKPEMIPSLPAITNSTPTTTPLVVLTQEDVNPLWTQTPTASEVIATPILPGVIPGEVITLTQTAEALLLIQPTTTAEDPLGECKYTIISGDTIGNLTSQFGHTAGDTTYYERIRCFEDVPDCNYNPDSVDDIFPGWILIFPDVLKSLCEARGEFLP